MSYHDVTLDTSNKSPANKKKVDPNVEIRVIEFVRNSPQLYNGNHHEFKKQNKGIRFSAWEHLATELHVEEKEIKRIWKYLRDRYLRELKKVLTGGKSEWKYFEPLGYLREVIEPGILQRSAKAAEKEKVKASASSSDSSMSASVHEVVGDRLPQASPPVGVMYNSASLGYMHQNSNSSQEHQFQEPPPQPQQAYHLQDAVQQQQNASQWHENNHQQSASTTHHVFQQPLEPAHHTLPPQQQHQQLLAQQQDSRQGYQQQLTQWVEHRQQQQPQQQPQQQQPSQTPDYHQQTSHHAVYQHANTQVGTYPPQSNSQHSVYSSEQSAAQQFVPPQTEPQQQQQQQPQVPPSQTHTTYQQIGQWKERAQQDQQQQQGYHNPHASHAAAVQQQQQQQPQLYNQHHQWQEAHGNHITAQLPAWAVDHQNQAVTPQPPPVTVSPTQQQPPPIPHWADPAAHHNNFAQQSGTHDIGELPPVQQTQPQQHTTHHLAQWQTAEVAQQQNHVAPQQHQTLKQINVAPQLSQEMVAPPTPLSQNSLSQNSLSQSPISQSSISQPLQVDHHTLTQALHNNHQFPITALATPVTATAILPIQRQEALLEKTPPTPPMTHIDSPKPTTTTKAKKKPAAPKTPKVLKQPAKELLGVPIANNKAKQNKKLSSSNASSFTTINKALLTTAPSPPTTTTITQQIPHHQLQSLIPKNAVQNDFQQFLINIRQFVETKAQQQDDDIQAFFHAMAVKVRSANLPPEELAQLEERMLEAINLNIQKYTS